MLVVGALSRDAGILYEIWHAGAAHLQHRVAATGATPLTVESVIRSDGVQNLDHVFSAAAVPRGFNPDIYNVEPALGFYWCIPPATPACFCQVPAFTRHATPRAPRPPYTRSTVRRLSACTAPALVRSLPPTRSHAPTSPLSRVSTRRGSRPLASVNERTRCSSRAPPCAPRLLTNPTRPPPHGLTHGASLLALRLRGC